MDTERYDPRFYEVVKNENDELEVRPRMQIGPIRDNSGFTTYDTSAGHCGLCGSLTCRGQCFK